MRIIHAPSLQGCPIQTPAVSQCMIVGRGDTFAGGLCAQGIMCLCFCSRGKLGQAKVPKLHVTACVIEDVGWLKILQVQMLWEVLLF